MYKPGRGSIQYLYFFKLSGSEMPTRRTTTQGAEPEYHMFSMLSLTGYLYLGFAIDVLRDAVIDPDQIREQYGAGDQKHPAQAERRGHRTPA